MGHLEFFWDERSGLQRQTAAVESFSLPFGAENAAEAIILKSELINTPFTPNWTFWSLHGLLNSKAASVTGPNFTANRKRNIAAC